MADQRANIFITGTDRSKAAFDSFTRNVEGVTRKVEGMQKLVTAGIAGITAVGIYRKFIAESIDAQNEQAQLAAVLRSTGEAAGWSQEQLNAMAEELSKSSIFSDGDINKAQTRLLSYSNIVGQVFPEAMQAVVDMSARLGMSLEQSAETIGKALDVPSQGLTALSRQGFRFTDEQKKLVEQLEKTGKTSQAQGIILEALTASYGGAAQAARDTFGGSLRALQNQIDSLVTGDDASINGATRAINNLTNALGSPATRQAFADFTAGLAASIQKVAEMSVEFARGIRYSDGFFDALKKYGLSNPWKSPQEQLTGLREELQGLEGDASKFGWMWTDKQKAANKDAIRGVQQQLGYWNDVVNTAKDAENTMLRANYRSRAPAPDPKGKSGGGGGGGGDGKGTKDDPTKKLLENALKDLERYVAGEAALLAQRNKFLDVYNDLGLLSIKTYFDEQQAALDAATANQLAGYDKQIEALRSYRAGVDKETERAEADGKIAALQAKRAEVEREAGLKALDIDLKRDDAKQALLRTEADITAQFKEMTGELAEAAGMRFDAQFEKTAQLFENNLLPGMTDMLARMREITVAQAQINAVTQKFSVIQGDLQMAEERITMALERGTMGQITALQRSGEVRRKAYADMQEQLQRYVDLESQVGLTDEQRQSFERLKLQAEQLGTTLDPFANLVNASTADAAGAMFRDVLSGSKSAKDAVNDFGDSVYKTINDLVSKQLGNALIKSLFGDSSGGGGLGGFVSQLFGGGGGGAKGGGGGGLFDWFAGFFAEGGDIPAGKAGIVGEKGMELIEGPATVTPLHKLGGQSISVSNHFSFSGPVDRRTQEQIAARVSMSAQRALARGTAA